MPRRFFRRRELANEESEKAKIKRGIVIFDTRYGNTERVARSFEEGLKQAGVETFSVNAKEANLESLKEYDLIAIAAPTEMITASKSIKEFLERLRKIDFSGKFGFAFDTRLQFPLSGSAAKFIEKELKSSGIDIVMPHVSAIVERNKEEEGGVKLKEGEEKKFELLGKQVGIAVMTKSMVLART